MAIGVCYEWIYTLNDRLHLRGISAEATTYKTLDIDIRTHSQLISNMELKNMHRAVPWAIQWQGAMEG